MLEPDVTLTDYALTVECAVLSFFVRRDGTRVPPRLALGLFAALGAGSLLGGTVHGFFPNTHAGAGAVLWRLMLLAVGLVACFAWLVGARLGWGERVYRNVRMLAAVNLGAYAFYAIAVDQRFVVAIVNYLPAVLFLLVAFAMGHRREGGRSWLLGVGGVLLTFVAAACQQLAVALHPRYFNHNAVYHAVQAVALALIYLGLRGESRLPSAPR